MNFGIIDQMWALPEIETSDYLRQTLLDVQLAEALGFDSFWFGEHHFHRTSGFYGRIPVPELLIARLAAETRSIRLGTGVKILPLDTPLHFAEEISLLDLLTDGRAVFGVGQGSGVNIDFLGLSDEEKHQRYRSHFAELLQHLSGEAVDGRAPLSPQPRRNLAALLWVASRDDESIAFAAQQGLNFVVGQAEPAQVQGMYVAAYRAAGGRGEARGCRIVFVAETDAAAHRQVEAAAKPYFSTMQKGKYYRAAVEQGVIPDTPPANMQELLRRIDFVAGSPQTVTAWLQTYAQTTGVDRLDLMMHIPGIAPDDLRRSMTLFAREVAPGLRLAGDGAAASARTA